MANACTAATLLATVDTFPEGTAALIEAEITWDTGATFDCDLIIKKFYGSSGTGLAFWVEQPAKGNVDFESTAGNTGMIVCCDSAGGTNGNLVLRPYQTGLPTGVPQTINSLVLQVFFRI